jgi:hypothetical protein
MTTFLGPIWNNRRNTFVWDPSLGPTGAWTRHDINARSCWRTGLRGTPILGLLPHRTLRLLRRLTGFPSWIRTLSDVDTYDASYDEINSYYHTGWFIGNRPTFPKRWGKTRSVVLADNNIQIYTYVYKDYDLSGYWASYYKTITGLDTPATWDSDPSGSGDGVWDTSEWQAQGTSDRYVFLRWPTVGTAQAISLRFSVNPSAHVSGQVGCDICSRHVQDTEVAVNGGFSKDVLVHTGDINCCAQMNDNFDDVVDWATGTPRCLHRGRLPRSVARWLLLNWQPFHPDGDDVLFVWFQPACHL